MELELVAMLHSPASDPFTTCQLLSDDSTILEPLVSDRAHDDPEVNSLPAKRTELEFAMIIFSGMTTAAPNVDVAVEFAITHELPFDAMTLQKAKKMLGAVNDDVKMQPVIDQVDDSVSETADTDGGVVPKTRAPAKPLVTNEQREREKLLSFEMAIAPTSVTLPAIREMNAEPSKRQLLASSTEMIFTNGASSRTMLMAHAAPSHEHLWIVHELLRPMVTGELLMNIPYRSVAVMFDSEIVHVLDSDTRITDSSSLNVSWFSATKLSLSICQKLLLVIAIDDF